KEWFVRNCGRGAIKDISNNIQFVAQDYLRLKPWEYKVLVFGLPVIYHLPHPGQQKQDIAKTRASSSSLEARRKALTGFYPVATEDFTPAAETSKITKKTSRPGLQPADCVGQPGKIRTISSTAALVAPSHQSQFSDLFRHRSSRFIWETRLYPYLSREAARFIVKEAQSVLTAYAKAKGISRNLRILDLMSGRFTYLPACVAKSAEEIVGVGLNSGELMANKRLKGKCKYKIMDINSAKFPQEWQDYFDAVIVTNGLGYVDNLQSFFTQIAGLLKPEGILFTAFTDNVYFKDASRGWRNSDHNQNIMAVKKAIDLCGQFNGIEHKQGKYSVWLHTTVYKQKPIDVVVARKKTLNGSLPEGKVKQASSSAQELRQSRQRINRLSHAGETSSVPTKRALIVELLDELSRDPGSTKVSAGDIASMLTGRGHTITKRHVTQEIDNLKLRKKYPNTLVYERQSSKQPKFSRSDILGAKPEEVFEIISAATGGNKTLTISESLLLKLDAQSQTALVTGNGFLTEKEKAQTAVHGFSHFAPIKEMRQMRRQAWMKLAPLLKRPALEEIGEFINDLTLREQEAIKWCLDARIRWEDAIKAKKLMAIRRQADEAVIVRPYDVGGILASARTKLKERLMDAALTAYFPNGIKFSEPSTCSQAKDEHLPTHQRIAEAIFVDGAETINEIAAFSGIPSERVDAFLKKSLQELRQYLRIQRKSRRATDVFNQQRTKVQRFVILHRVDAPVVMTDIVKHIYDDSYTPKQYRSVWEDVCVLQRSGVIRPYDVIVGERSHREKQAIASQQGKIVKIIKHSQVSKIRPTIPDITAQIYGSDYTNEQRKTVRTDVKALVAARKLDPDVIETRYDIVAVRRQRIVAFARKNKGNGKLTIPEISAHVYGRNYSRQEYLRIRRDAEALIAAGEINASEIKGLRAVVEKRALPVVTRASSSVIVKPGDGPSTDFSSPATADFVPVVKASKATQKNFLPDIFIGYFTPAIAMKQLIGTRLRDCLKGKRKGLIRYGRRLEWSLKIYAHDKPVFYPETILANALYELLQNALFVVLQRENGAAKVSLTQLEPSKHVGLFRLNVVNPGRITDEQLRALKNRLIDYANKGLVWRKRDTAGLCVAREDIFIGENMIPARFLKENAGVYERLPPSTALACIEKMSLEEFLFIRFLSNKQKSNDADVGSRNLSMGGKGAGLATIKEHIEEYLGGKVTIERPEGKDATMFHIYFNAERIPTELPKKALRRRNKYMALIELLAPIRNFLRQEELVFDSLRNEWRPTGWVHCSDKRALGFWPKDYHRALYESFADPVLITNIKPEVFEGNHESLLSILERIISDRYRVMPGELKEYASKNQRIVSEINDLCKELGLPSFPREFLSAEKHASSSASKKQFIEAAIENEIRQLFVHPGPDDKYTLWDWQRKDRVFDGDGIYKKSLMLERGKDTVGKLGIKPGDTFLDIGTGPLGGFSFIAALSGAKVVAIENKPEVIMILKDKYRKLEPLIKAARGRFELIEGDFSNPSIQE
ncbi:MAG: methyltransferase domain-containing protein, partial [Candidatus Omnitrophica bacterium]|nr:methyltransferase domain-containing protein [Candidatus Omnitrophota bacterium]